MNRPFGQFPNQPGLHGSKQQFAPICPFSGSFHMIQDPLHLRTGKIGIDHKTCFLLKHLGKTFFFQAVTIFRSPPALPDNRIVYRFSGIFIPHDRSFSLVGNSDCCNIRCRSMDLVHCLSCNGKLCGPDFPRIMLHPAGLWKVLGKFLLCHAADFPFFIE